MTEALLGFLAIFAMAVVRIPLAFAMGFVGFVEATAAATSVKRPIRRPSWAAAAPGSASSMMMDRPARSARSRRPT